MFDLLEESQNEPEQFKENLELQEILNPPKRRKLQAILGERYDEEASAYRAAQREKAEAEAAEAAAAREAAEAAAAEEERKKAAAAAAAAAAGAPGAAPASATA